MRTGEWPHCPTRSNVGFGVRIVKMLRIKPDDKVLDSISAGSKR